MATSSKRDVKLAVGIETTGGASVRTLADEVRRLGAEGAPAAAEFQALADQIDRLGDQVDAVAALKALDADVERLAASQREAAAATKIAKDALEAQSIAAVQLREQQSAAARAVAEGVAGTRAAGDAVKALKREYDAAGKATQEYRDKAAAADAAVTAAKNRVDELRGALKTAAKASTDASTEEGRLAAAYLRTQQAASQADAAVRERATSLRAAQASAAGLALSTTDLAQADAQLLDTQARLLTQLRALQAEQAERAALDERNAAVVQRTEQTVRALASAYDAEQAALAESAAAAARSAAEKQRLVDATEKAAAAERAEAAAIEAANAKRREQQEHDQQAAIAAYRLAEARKAAQAAAQSELLLLKDSEEFTRRYAQAQREAAAAVEREGVEAMRLLEQASRAADKAQEQLVTSLRATETAAERYAAAIGEAAAAGELDVAAAQKRRAAAEALIASERELTAEQREAALARDRSRAALVDEAQALLASARAAEESRAATSRLVQQALALGTAVDKGSASIRQMGAVTEQAFGTVGIRGLQSIEAEVNRVDMAMQRLAADLRAGRISTQDFDRALGSATVKLAALNREAAQVNALPGQFEKISSSIQSVISRFGALGAAVATVGVAVRPVIDATIALEQMRRTLTTVTGSADSAAAQIDWLRNVSQQSGQSFTEVGQSYAKFAASALQTGLSIKQVQDVFKSVALAAGNLGLSSDQAKRALEALGQMASKGVVSMEELRQQLGDALPGVLPLLAKELGLTTAELNKVVESGNLLSQEAIPAIGRALQSLQPQDGVVNGMVASWNRFINVVKQAGTTLVEGPLGQAAGVGLTALAGVIRDLSVVAVGASEAFKLFGLSTLAVFDALTPGGAKLKDLGKTLDDFAQQAATNIQKYRDVAYGAAEGADKLAESSTKLGGSFAALSLEQQKAIDSAVLAAQSSEKNVQAKKAEGEATTTLSGLLGDETAAREAAVLAAQRSAEATRDQAAADDAVVAALTRAKAAIAARAEAEGWSAEVTKKATEELDKKILKATADAEKTHAQAGAARAHAAALDLANESMRNNAGRLDELKRSVADLAIAYENTKIAVVAGAASENDARAAAEALAKAKGLLRDAINDVSEALDRQIKSMQADVKLAEAGIKLEVERQKNAIIAAKNAGDEYAARQASLKIKELELQLGNLSVDQKRAEAEATLNAIDTQEAELRSLGLLTPERVAEFEARRKVQLAAVLESQAANEAAKSKRVEFDELRKGTPAREAHNKATGEGTTATTRGTEATRQNSSAIESNTGSTNTNAGALRGAANAQDALTAARQRYIQLLIDSRGFEGLGVTGNNGLAGIVDERYTGVRDAGGQDNLLTDLGGKNLSVLSKNDMTPVDNSGMFALIDKYEKGQIGAGDYGALQAALAAARNNSYMTAQSSIGSSRLGEYAAIEAKLAAAAQSAYQQQQSAKYNLGGTFGGVKGRTVEVKLNVGGKSVPLETTSSNADQLLKLLADAQRSAGGA